VRAIVIALDNLDPIPDGATLYTCDVEIAAGASGSFPLTCANPGAGDPDGVRIGADCTDGAITVAVPSVATLVVGEAVGAAGDDVPLDVSLQTTVDVAGTQNDLTFPDEAGVVADNDGAPTCSVNPAINKNGTAFSFQPPGCTPGTDCTGIRALVLSLSNVNPIPSGSVLYTCTVSIAEDAASGTYDVVCSNAGASDPGGTSLPTECLDGEIVVGVQPTRTFTPTPTVPTNTPTAGTPSATPTVTATGTLTVSPTRTSRPQPPDTEDDGCNIAAPADNGAAWMLLAPLAALLAVRRKRTWGGVRSEE
jgi:MYXO-CTERM domain-containing protein